MSPTLNGSSAIRRFKHSNVIKIRDGITFDFYMGLPHIQLCTRFKKSSPIGSSSELIMTLYKHGYRPCLKKSHMISW